MTSDLPGLEQHTRDSTLPIVVDVGAYFLQVLYAADEDMRSRLVLLTAPDQDPARDPANENMRLRSAKYAKYIHLAKLKDFLETPPLLSSDGNANPSDRPQPRQGNVAVDERAVAGEVSAGGTSGGDRNQRGKFSTGED